MRATFLLALMAAVGQSMTIPTPENGRRVKVKGFKECGKEGCTSGWATQDLGAVRLDVPPKEWDGPDMEEGPCPIGFACMDNKVPVHHRTCTDKSRFLLMSEDNRWHCLALGAKP